MATLFYGNGEVSIEGGEAIRGVQINYSGAIAITQTANNNYTTIANNDKIIIFPIAPVSGSENDTNCSPVGQGYLNKLFTYTGEFKVHYVLAADSNGEKIVPAVKKVMDYSELLDSNSETIDIKSENISVGHISNSKVASTTVNRNMKDNLQTNDKIVYYLKDGSEYKGKYHIHLADSGVMTGAVHTKNSLDLYYKKSRYGKIIDELVPTRNPGHVPRGLRRPTKKSGKTIAMGGKKGKIISGGGGY